MQQQQQNKDLNSMEYDESDGVIRMASDEQNAVNAESMSTPLLLPGDIRGQTSTASLIDNDFGGSQTEILYGNTTNDMQLVQDNDD